MKDMVKVRGFGRVQLLNVKTGKIEGDSGWKRNTVTESGFDDAIVGAIGKITASSQTTHVQMGTQTDAPASTQTTLSGEFGTRVAIASGGTSLVGNGTLRTTVNFATDENTQSTIGAVGLYGSSSGSSCLNVITVATSNKTTDQQANVTVEWRFS